MSTKYKIVYLIDTLQTGGAEKSLVEMAVANKQVQSYFITLYTGNALAPILEEHNIPLFALNSNRKYGFKEAVKKIIPIIQEIQPDLIHTTLFRADMVGRLLKSHFNIPLISSIVSNSYLEERYEHLSLPGKLKLYAVQWYDRRTAPGVNLFIANSETVKASNAQFLKVPLSKIKVIYRGRMAEVFNNVNTNKLENLKKDLGASGKKVLLNVSRLLDSKGQLDLINAFAAVVLQHPNALLLIAGEGPFRNIVDQQIKTLGLQDKVHLLGNRNDVPELLALAHVFVFPSYYEGLPGAILEAMFAKKIIICSDIPENKECVSEASAVFFKKGLINDLADKINHVLLQQEAYMSRALEAEKIAHQKFDIDIMVQQYNNVYQQLIQHYKS
ncbi:MAG: glycosyltransferase family 4 protein [Flavobacteriaceae bacterium]|nr:glycosyltransferase family 4 protein [Flavobacteriaceae bacterium]